MGGKVVAPRRRDCGGAEERSGRNGEIITRDGLPPDWERGCRWLCAMYTAAFGAMMLHAAATGVL